MSLRWTVLTLCAAALSFTSYGADSLDGKTITLEAGDQMSVDVPISIPFDGTIAAGEVIHVSEPKTGKSFPATLRDGALTFVPEGAMPKTEHVYTVKVDKDVRPPHVQMKKHDDKNAIDVMIDDVLFTTYHYEKEARKPYLWPVLSNGDVGVTRDYPMGKALMTGDHPHHRSFWSAYGNVNGADCWMEEENKAGWQETNEVTYGSGDAYGWIVAKNTWADVNHKPVCKEEREYRFYTGQKEARLVDVKVTFTPIDEDVKFGDTKEGGIVSFRMNDQMTEKETYEVVDKAGKVLGMYDVRKEADDEAAKNAGSEVKARPKGVITLTDGRTGMANCWGKPSPWCDYSGTIDGAGVHGITAFDNPGNLRYPTTWHVRDYGLMARTR